MQKTILLNYFKESLCSSFPTSSRPFSEFDVSDIILFQIKVFDEKINGTPLGIYLMKHNWGLLF